MMTLERDTESTFILTREYAEYICTDAGWLIDVGTYGSFVMITSISLVT